MNFRAIIKKYWRIVVLLSSHLRYFMEELKFFHIDVQEIINTKAPKTAKKFRSLLSKVWQN